MPTWAVLDWNSMWLCTLFHFVQSSWAELCTSFRVFFDPVLMASFFPPRESRRELVWFQNEVTLLGVDSGTNPVSNQLTLGLRSSFNQKRELFRFCFQLGYRTRSKKFL